MPIGLFGQPREVGRLLRCPTALLAVLQPQQRAVHPATSDRIALPNSFNLGDPKHLPPFAMPSKFGTKVPHGVYAPLTTFFRDSKNQDLDLETYKSHVKYVASAGVGIVALGSMGEAVHLSHEERNLVVQAAREALDSDPSLADVPLIAGTGASSTRETIELTKEAASHGADFAMVIAPGYFAGALDKSALKTFFVEVAEASPIPVSSVSVSRQQSLMLTLANLDRRAQ